MPLTFFCWLMLLEGQTVVVTVAKLMGRVVLAVGDVKKRVAVNHRLAASSDRMTTSRGFVWGIGM